MREFEMKGTILIFAVFISCMTLFAGNSKTLPARKNVALHCPVYSQNGEGGEYAVDGKRNGAFHHARISKNNFLEIDLGEVRNVDGVKIFFFWNDFRSYQFYFTSSIDGEKYTMLYDASQNKKRATKEGQGIDFPAKKMRFVKVYVTNNTANVASHIREIEIYGK